MNEYTKQLMSQALCLPEYERKQMISILITSMLNEKSLEDSRKAYDDIHKQLRKYTLPREK